MESQFLFPTPIFVVPLLDAVVHHHELTQRLVAESQAVTTVSRSNVGGWHSRPDLAMRPEGCYQSLLRSIVDQVCVVTDGLARQSGRALPPYGFGLQGWAMVMRRGHYAAVHDHSDSHWSVVYYVDVGEEAPAPSGQLTFIDPRRSGRTLDELGIFQSAFSITPRAGFLVIFPGWLQHYVHPSGTRCRHLLFATVPSI